MSLETAATPIGTGPQAVATLPGREIKTSEQPAAKPAAQVPRRLLSLDAYRGLIMLTLLVGESGLCRLGAEHSGPYWDFLKSQFDHSKWISNFHGIGFVYFDLIQPAFMFMVGVSMPYSYARRRERGDSWISMFVHVLTRCLILVAIGVFLWSKFFSGTEFIFYNVLAQIGLGYWFVFLLLGRSVRLQLCVAATILIAFWLAFVLYPIQASSPGADPASALPGFWAHWSHNANLASAFDRRYLNLLPQAAPYAPHPGGYVTLSFIPSAVTMLFGLMAGELLRRVDIDSKQKCKRLVISGAVCMALALLTGYTICPIIKRIWTPSWTLFSGAYVLWTLAAFYWVVEIANFRRWTFPLVVFGMNSIAVYLAGELLVNWTAGELRHHFHFTFAGPNGILYQSLAVTLTFWLVCLWLYRQKTFIRI